MPKKNEKKVKTPKTPKTTAAVTDTVEDPVKGALVRVRNRGL